jgi:hypothetical protein
MIVLILAVFYVQHVGAELTPDAFLFGRDGGWTMAECKASGEAKVAEALTVDGVLGASFKCVEMPKSAGL